MLFLVFLIDVVYGEPCGEPPLCNCEHDLGISTCYGGNITQILQFSTEVKSNTIFFDVINTNITEFPSLESWPNLMWVTLRGNSHLPCSLDVIKIDYVDSDCTTGPVVYSDADNEFSPEHSELLQMLYALIIIPFGFTLASGYIYYVKRKRMSGFSEAEKNMFRV